MLEKKPPPGPDGRAALFLEELFDAVDILEDVYANGIVLDFGDTDLGAVFHPTELFELLDFFEDALGEGRVFEQGIAAEDVEAEVLQVADFEAAVGVADPGDGGAREIKGVFVEVEYDLNHIGVHDIGGGLDCGSDGADAGFGILEEGFDGGVHGGGVEEGLVALDVDKDVAFYMGGDLCNAFGAGAVVGAGHAGFATKGADGLEDAVVVGGDNHLVDGFCGFGALVDPLNHGLTGEHYQWLAGETRRSVSRWYYHYDFPRTHRCKPFPTDATTAFNVILRFRD